MLPQYYDVVRMDSRMQDCRSTKQPIVISKRKTFLPRATASKAEQTDWCILSPFHQKSGRERNPLIASTIASDSPYESAHFDVIRITVAIPNLVYGRAGIKNTETLHERCWEVPRLLCSVVGCVTDWQQETRSLCLLMR